MVWEEARKIYIFYFSRPPPPRAIIPDARPLGTSKNQDGRHLTVRRARSRRSHGKIGDCEQSMSSLNSVLVFK